MKRYIQIVGTLILTVFFAGCEQIQGLSGSSPERVLAAYLDATLKADWESAYGFISEQDQAVKSLDVYQAEAAEASVLTSAILSKTTFRITSTERSEDTAKATVEITAPDLSELFTEMIGSAFASAFSTKKSDDIQKQIVEKVKGSTLPMTVQSEEFNLVRGDKGWRVFLDWSNKEKVAGLIAEAEQLQNEKKLRAARVKYDEVLKLDSRAVAAQKARNELDREIAAFEEKQEYVGNIELYDFRAKFYDTYLEKRIPGVEFKLRNKGDRILRKLKVTVYFEDATGAVIAEEDYHPVLVNKYSFGENKPLKPNYVWQLERSKFYQAKTVPNEWKEGAATAKITDIEFMEASE